MQKYFDEIKQRLGKGSSYAVKLKPERTEFFGDIAFAHGVAQTFGHRDQLVPVNKRWPIREQIWPKIYAARFANR